MTFEIRTKDGEILTVHTLTGEGLSRVLVEHKLDPLPFDKESIGELLSKLEQAE